MKKHASKVVKAMSGKRASAAANTIQITGGGIATGAVLQQKVQQHRIEGRHGVKGVQKTIKMSPKEAKRYGQTLS